MEYKPWMDYITVDDMPNDDLKTIAENAGLQAAIALVFGAPGLTVNIPKEAFRAVKERYIIDKYDGTKYSVNNLAIQCGFSQRNIYQIIKRNLEKQQKFLPQLPE